MPTPPPPFQALALCVPVVTLPSKVAVLQMTLAQIRAYGPSYERVMVARTADDYIDKVVGSVLEDYTAGFSLSYSFHPNPSVSTLTGSISLACHLNIPFRALFASQTCSYFDRS